MLLPVWLAVIVQEPAATAVKVVPLTVQTDAGLAAKPTVNEDDAVADKAAVLPMAGAVGEAKVIVCASPLTEKLTVTGVAVGKLVLPAWLATTVQVPSVIGDSVLPLTVQTADVVDA